MTSDTDSANNGLDTLLHRHFLGRTVRKDLTKLVKEGANVPIYVLEYLLGNYCATDDPVVIEEGLANVKRVLAENYVRPDEAEKMKSFVKERASLRVIDKVTVRLNERRNIYEAHLFNLGTKGIEVSSHTVTKYDKLLTGGIWSIITLKYNYEPGQRGSPFIIEQLKPIQMASMDMDEVLEARPHFAEDEWLDMLLRSSGYEPSQFEDRTKWHLLCRLLPLAENNFNVCELGPRGTGKSHIYKEISPYSVLVSGGQTTVPNLFYNLSTRRVGLVGVWDVVAFDEVAGIRFKDPGGVQIMKDYMASGSFVRGTDQTNANASMVFIGNINQPVEELVKISHLLAPFPEVMIDAAFFDRFHAYIPGWEIPKMRPEFFTNHHGLIVDYLAEFLREMRKHSFADAIGKYFSLGSDINQRDSIAIRHTASGLLKLLYPDESYDKDAVRRCLEYALETRRRVKEQLKKIGGMEFFDVNFSYVDIETMEERFVGVPEQTSGGLIPSDPTQPGTLHAVAAGDGSRMGIYRLESQVTKGTGKLTISGAGLNGEAKEQIKVGFAFFKANVLTISALSNPSEHDYHIQVADLLNTGASSGLTLATHVALCSGLLDKSVQPGVVIFGSISIGGIIARVSSLASAFQVASDAGASKALLPITEAGGFASIPPELLQNVQPVFFADAKTAVFRGLQAG